MNALTKQQRQLLRDQVIDENGPGSILRDFGTLLDFIGADGIPAGGKHNFLPMKVFLELNTRLAHPLDIDLKRPMQKSLPPINGLYLLLRTTGLVEVKRVGKKSFLVLDQQMLASWCNLNPTERYFILLEAWLFRSDPGTLGERESWAGTPPIWKWAEFFEKIPEEGLKIAGDRAYESMINYRPGLYTLALLELFGLLSIQHGKPESGKGWRIMKVQRTAFGDALLRLLHKPFYNFDLMDDLVDHETEITEQLQSLVQPLFPEWRETLARPETEFVDGDYVFKVSVGRSWRRIVIAGTMSFQSLAYSILDAYDFDYDHLYCFTYKDRFGVPVNVNHPYMDEPPFADQTDVGSLGLEPGSVMNYLYDFGDQWEFDVQLERVDPVTPGSKKPRLVASHGEAPDQYRDWSW